MKGGGCLRVDVTDAALFLYPEFVLLSKSLSAPGKGFSLTPPSSKTPGSAVENVVMSKTTAERVVDAIDCAIATLTESERMILHLKYGWHYEVDRLVITPPVGTMQVYDILHKSGEYRWSESTFKCDLAEIRKRVGDYLDSLGPTLKVAFAAMPKRKKRVRKLTDEEFEKVRVWLEERQLIEKEERVSETP